MTVTESYTAVVDQARSATEKSVEIWKQGAKTLTNNAGVVSQLPKLDLTQSMERYFEWVQQTFDANHELALKWAAAATSISDIVREQAENFGNIVREQFESVAQVATEQAGVVEQIAKKQAKQVHENAREQYQGLTKSELAELLVERDLPKTGNVDELIERLVIADGK